MRIIPELKEGTHRAKATGTLPNGKPVVVNADGTVSVVVSTGTAFSKGSAVVVDSDRPTEGMTAVYDSSNNKVVVIYSDSGNSDYGTAIVGTVSGTSISFGSPVVFNSGNSQKISGTFDSNSNKVIPVWNQVIGGSLRAIVGTVSGSSISFGSSATFSSNGTSSPLTACFDSSSNKVIVAYSDNGNSGRGAAVVGTVSGTSISFGSETVFESGDTSGLGIAHDSNANKTVIGFQRSNTGYSIVGTVSGTSISFGARANIDGNNNAERIFLTFDSTNNKVVFGYTARSDSESCAAIVGTVSGTSISFGDPSFFIGAGVGNYQMQGIAFDSSNDKIVFSTRFEGAAQAINISSASVSGTSLVFGDNNEAATGAASFFAPIVYDASSDKLVLFYDDVASSRRITSLVTVVDTLGTNLTSENYIGMSGGVVSSESGTQAIGSASVFESASSSYLSSTFDSSNNKVVVAYNDNGNSYYGTAVVGTVSGTSISFGTPIVFESSNSQFISVTYDANAAKVVISYADGSNSNHGTAIVGTVSGTSISFGSLAVFESAVSYYMSSAYDSTSQKVVIAYQDGGNSSYGTAVVGTVSGTSISFGTPAVFEAASTSNTSVAYDSNAQKVVISYTDGGNSSYLTAVVGTVSGTNISFGTPVSTGEVSTDLSSVFDISSNKVVITYNTSGTGKAVVGTVSGTGISFGSSVVFDTNNADNVSATYDVNSTKVIVLYRENSLTGYGTFAVGTVDGTSISFAAPVAFNSTNGTNTSSTYDSASQKIVAAYTDTNNSSFGTSVVIQPAFTKITRGQVNAGSSATVDIIGSLSTNQSGLTAGQSYYVQTDGTIGETAASPSVFAGTAISATSLVVKT